MALVVTVLVLALWAGVTLYADPLAAGLAEVLDRIELSVIGGEFPWMP